jgi:hypothetical protein
MHCRTRISPTHIAFTATSRLDVRDCYTAALNAGGRPNGAPGERRDGCGCFNAAVIDHDGNTVEFIYRQATESGDHHGLPAPSELSRSQTWQDDSRSSRYIDDTQSLSSKASRAKSRAQTALDVASATSKSTKKSAAPPTPGITRSRTDPLISDNSSKKLVGTLLGAAAGAAVAYAMVQSERDGSRDEAEFARSKAGSNRSSRPRSIYEKSTVSRNSGRSSRHPNRPPLAIEPRSYSEDELHDVLSRYTSSRRPALQRSRTYDAIEYAPMSTTSNMNDRYSMKRSSTLPDYYPDGTRTAPASRHTSRRGSMDDTRLKRHDSGVSVQSHRSRRSFDGGRRSSASNASTLKPSRRASLYDSAANVPLPSSKPQSYVSAAEMPLPSSRATSYISAAQMPFSQSRANGGYAVDPAEESDGLGDMKSVVPEDSISCVDFSTKPRKDKSSSKSSRHGSKRSEASTVRPVKQSSGSKYSAQTLPDRPKDNYHSSRDGKRSANSYA